MFKTIKLIYYSYDTIIKQQGFYNYSMTQGVSKIKSGQKTQQTNKSKLRDSEQSKIVNEKDFSKLQQEIIQIKYPIKPVDSAQDLDDKITSFSDESVRKQLKTLLKDYNTYRQVRGDGNCFFRAIAFQILSQKKDVYANTCFNYLDSISLTVCIQQSIPKQFRPFYDDRFLKKVLKKNWTDGYREYLRKYQGNFRISLATHLAANPYLDFIVILYFRSVCVYALDKYQQDFKDFLEGTEKKHMATYGEESEGVIINLCSRYLRVNIEVFQVRAKQVLQYLYTSEKQSTISSTKYSVTLLFYQNHYDIIQENDDRSLKLQKSEKSKEKQVQYFQQISLKTIEGQCIECNDKNNIYQENGLCQKCYEKSKNSLDSYKKDKLIKARCNQCYYTCYDVSEQLMLCQDCIKAQKLYAQNKYDCQVCKAPIRIKGKCQKCQKFDKEYMKREQYKYGICASCNYRQRISVQLGICKNCQQYQERYSDKILQRQKKAQDEVKKCSKCDSQSKQLSENHLCSKCQEYRLKHFSKYQNKVNQQKLKCKKCDKIYDSDKYIKDKVCFKCSQSQKEKIKKCKQCQKDFKPHLNDNEVCVKCYQQSRQSHKCKDCKKQMAEQSMDGMCKQCYSKTSKYRINQKQIPKITRCIRCKQLSQIYFSSLCKSCFLKQKNENQVVKCKICSKTSNYYTLKKINNSYYCEFCAYRYVK